MPPALETALAAPAKGSDCCRTSGSGRLRLLARRKSGLAANLQVSKPPPRLSASAAAASAARTAASTAEVLGGVAALV